MLSLGSSVCGVPGALSTEKAGSLPPSSETLLRVSGALPVFWIVMLRVCDVPRGTTPKSSEPLTAIFGSPTRPVAEIVFVAVNCAFVGAPVSFGTVSSVSITSDPVRGPEDEALAGGENFTWKTAEWPGDSVAAVGEADDRL